jgi:hypothetical protein
MQTGDILTAAEYAYIEAMEDLIFLLAMGNTEIETLEAKAHEVRALCVEPRTD